MIKQLIVCTAFLLAVMGCGKIKHSLRGEQGSPGYSGADGAPGQDGEDGQDGAQGPQGPQGPAGAAAVLEVIDVCGDSPGLHDEVILRLANGQLLASYSDNANGNNTRFAIITPGSYVTTDGSYCHFSVNNVGVVSW